jgi:NHL repeat-containing protein
MSARRLLVGTIILVVVLIALYVLSGSPRRMSIPRGASSQTLVFSKQLTGAETPEKLFPSLQGIAVESHGGLYVQAGGTELLQLNSAGEYISPQPLTGTSEPLKGTPLGEFENLREVAVDQSTGDVYLSEQGVVDEFEASGKFLRQITGSGSPFAEFASARAIALSTHGDLYVADVINKVIEEYGPSGEYLEPQPLTGTNEPFNGSNGTGTPHGTLLEAPWSITLDTQGDLYVTDLATKALYEYTPTGALVLQLTNVPSSAPIPGELGSPRGVAVDTDGDIYIADSEKKAVDEFTSTGEYLAQLIGVPASAPVGGRFGSPNSLSIDTNNNLYITDTSNKVIDEFSLPPLPPPAIPPAITSTSVSNITPFTATLNGAINPNSVPAAYHFLYGTSTAYGNTAPDPDITLPPGTTSTTTEPQNITGLQPATTYHYTLTASGPGGSTTTPDQTFTTPSIPPPTATTGPPTTTTETTATLTGTINPQGWPTTYTFQYGTTTSYQATWPTIPITLGAPTTTQNITIYLENLQPTTTYHYRLTATNPGGTTYGPDQTLTTTSYPPSTIQETPSLNTTIGINPETHTPTTKKHKPKKTTRHKTKTHKHTKKHTKH